MSWASWTRPYVPEEEGKEVNHGRMGWKEWRINSWTYGMEGMEDEIFENGGVSTCA